VARLHDLFMEEKGIGQPTAENQATKTKNSPCADIFNEKGNQRPVVSGEGSGG
jgi:hypothetical protein